VEVEKSVGRGETSFAQSPRRILIGYHMQASLWKPTEHVHFCFLDVPAIYRLDQEREESAAVL
jgi:hypothetical protein